MLTSSGYISNKDDELDEDGNYLDIIQSPSYSDLKKRLKVRRLICRVCKLKFRTREEILLQSNYHSNSNETHIEDLFLAVYVLS